MPKGIHNEPDINRINRIKDYIDRHFIITGNPEDRILSCHIHQDIVSFHNKYLWEYNGMRVTSKILLNYSGVKRKVMGANQYHIGIKYRDNQKEIEMMYDKQLDRSSIGQ